MKLRVLSAHCLFILLIVCSLSVSGCGSGSSESSVADDTTETEGLAKESDIVFSSLDDTSDWTAGTHEKLDTTEIIANMDVVFDKSKVQKMRIVVDYDNWILMNLRTSILILRISAFMGSNSLM